ncbi:MAG TPA: NUDIX hydrolase [Candidatus Saccharimonadales bacterium]|nr:NUDIX hydrolase [Candidatus Saccharimonadales bacterium]
MSVPILQVAAKAVIVNDEGKVLIVRESVNDPNNTQVGLWGLPGGRLEPGEAFLDGLKREALEEVGLNIEAGRPLCMGEWHPTIQGIPHHIIAFFVRCKPLTTNVQLSDEHDAYEWLDLNELDKYALMDDELHAFKALATELA